MVSIGNFRSQQLTLGATNRNTGILKTNLQVSTGNTKFKPTGKTTLQPLVQITPGKCEGKKDGEAIPIILVDPDGGTHWELNGERISESEATDLLAMYNKRITDKALYELFGAY